MHTCQWYFYSITHLQMKHAGLNDVSGKNWLTNQTNNLKGFCVKHIDVWFTKSYCNIPPAGTP